MSEKDLIPQALKRLLELPGVTDILVDGAKNCLVDVGRGLEQAPNPYESEQELVSAIRQLAFDAGARLDLAKPAADFMIGRVRFHAILPFGISATTLVSIRVHPVNQISLSELAATGFIDLSQRNILEQALANRSNLIISGPTSAGKTTLLAALIAELRERVICIEQMPELQIRWPAIRIFEREANQDGLGEISMQQLLTHSLRMRPDRIVVGEVRGAELGQMLQAMNNGHSGTMATLHARSLHEVPNRLISLGMLAGLSQKLVSNLAGTSIDLVIQVGIVNRLRKVVAIGKLSNFNRNLEIEPLNLMAAA
jgi:pilus assembly protein CpaF